MSNNRTLVFIAVGALALAGAAFATLPATAEEEIDLDVSVTLESTSPRVTGTVTVLADGVAVPGATMVITSTHDLLPLPAAQTNGATGIDGTYGFDFGLVSTAGAPGAHTLTVEVTYGGVTETVSVPYEA